MASLVQKSEQETQANSWFPKHDLPDVRPELKPVSNFPPHSPGTCRGLESHACEAFRVALGHYDQRGAGNGATLRAGSKVSQEQSESPESHSLTVSTKEEVAGAPVANSQIAPAEAPQNPVTAVGKDPP